MTDIGVSASTFSFGVLLQPQYKKVISNSSEMLIMNAISNLMFFFIFKLLASKM